MVGLEPTRGISLTDFESVTSANSITPARGIDTILPGGGNTPGRVLRAVFSACAAHPSRRRFSITQVRHPHAAALHPLLPDHAVPPGLKKRPGRDGGVGGDQGASTARSSRSQSAVAMLAPWRSLCTYSRVEHSPCRRYPRKPTIRRPRPPPPTSEWCASRGPFQRSRVRRAIGPGVQLLRDSRRRSPRAPYRKTAP